MLCKTNNGLTLIEFLIVIIVLGILSVTALPRFVGKAGVEEITVQDQMISVLRRMQTQAMQQTNVSFLPAEGAAERIPRCHQLILTATQLGQPNINPCLLESQPVASANPPELTATASDSALHFRLPQGSTIVISASNSASGAGAALSLPLLFKFNSLGQPLDSASNRYMNGLRFDVSGAVTYQICIESEGYIHSC
jgi:MSHA pilin protein MshC